MLYCLPFSIRFYSFYPSSLPLASIMSHCLCTVNVFALSSVEYLAYIEHLNEKNIQGQVYSVTDIQIQSFLLRQLSSY